MAVNSLEDKRIVTETVIINMRGYSFEITDKSITRYGLNTQETSLGYLVKSHFESVFGVLYLSHLLKDTGVKESIAMYWMVRKRRRHMKMRQHWKTA